MLKFQLHMTFTLVTVNFKHFVMELKSKPSFSLPWKQRLLFSIYSTVTGAAIRGDGSVNRRLINFVMLRTKPTSEPINGVKTHDVVVDPTRKLWFRVFVPTKEEATEDLPVIVYFHGGGFTFFSPDSKIYDDMCQRFAREWSAIVVSVDYRLAPEHRYPAQHNDCFDVLRFLDNYENKSKWLPANANISRCFLAGDSAGGNLAHHVAQRACEADFHQLKVIGIVAIQTFFGSEERTDSEKELEQSLALPLKRADWHWSAFMPVGEDYNRDHPIINVSGPKALDISKVNFPPTLLVVGGFDILRDSQKMYYEWLRKSEKEVYLVEYPSMFHGFYSFPELPESVQLTSDVKEFIYRDLKNV